MRQLNDARIHAGTRSLPSVRASSNIPRYVRESEQTLKLRNRTQAVARKRGGSQQGGLIRDDR